VDLGPGPCWRVRCFALAISADWNVNSYADFGEWGGDRRRCEALIIKLATSGIRSADIAHRADTTSAA
jgi:hypothetical protein